MTVNDSNGNPINLEQALQEMVDCAAAIRHYRATECEDCKGTGKTRDESVKKFLGEECSFCQGVGKRDSFWPRVITGSEYPAELHGNGLTCKRGSWVKVRPCDKKYNNKTYLGVMLGDLAISIRISVDNDGKLTILSHNNPAIYVPDLKEIIWGCGSWWGEVKDPNDLREISDADINNTWYVKCLAELTKKENTSVVEGASPGSINNHK